MITPCCGGGGAGAITVDHIAPEVLVGNTLQGDDATSWSGGGFRYVADVGNGAGIVAAIAALAGRAGVIELRSGTYDLGAVGAPATPIAVPANVILVGHGIGATIIVGKNAGNQGIFTLANNASLQAMTVEVPLLTSSSVVSTAAIACTNTTILEDVEVRLATGALGSMRQGVSYTLAAGLPNAESTMRNVVVRMSTKTGAVSPTVGVLVTTGATLRVNALRTIGGDVGFSTDRSFCLINNYTADSYGVSGLIQTNSTGAAGGGQVEMTGFRFNSDGSAGVVSLNVGWFTSSFRNGFIAQTGGAHGILVNRVGSTLGSNSFAGIYISGGAIGVELRACSTASLDDVKVFPAAGGTGILVDGSAFCTISKARIEMGTGVGIDVTATSAVITIPEPTIVVADGGAFSATAIRIRGQTSAVRGGEINATTIGVPILVDATTNVEVSGIAVFVGGGDTSANACIRLLNSNGCRVVGTSCSSTGRNTARIQLAATVANNNFGNVVSANRTIGPNGQPAIDLDTNTTLNQIGPNFGQGAAFGGVLVVTDAGTLNNVFDNNGS